MKASPARAMNLAGHQTKRSPIAASPSNTLLRESNSGIENASGGKSGRHSPKSPLENFEDVVVKRLNAAVSSVTSNLEAVSRQIMLVNDSFVESIGFSGTPDTLVGVKDFNSTARTSFCKPSPEKNASSRHSSPGAHYLSEVDQIEAELMRTRGIDSDAIEDFQLLNGVKKANINFHSGSLESIVRSSSPFATSMNGLRDVTSGENCDEEVDEDEGYTELPENIIDLIENSLKDKLRVVVRTKGSQFL
jgi:hypothetical protein